MTSAFGPILDGLRGVRWPAGHRVTGRASGVHASRQRGAVGEFAEYRLYRQGDDPRTLDWKLLARSDRPFVRLADDRVQRPTCVLLDASASMAYPASGAGTSTKWERAAALAVGVLAVARATGDPVGCVVAHPTAPLLLRPRSRRGTLEAIMAHVQRLAPAGEAPLAPGLSAVPPDARLVVITDALGDQDMLVQRLRSRPAGRGPITLLHVVARDELELPSGVHRVDDPERPMEPRQISPAHRQAYVERFADFRRQVAGLWRELGATCTLVTTDDDPVRSVRALVAQASSEIGSVRP